MHPIARAGCMYSGRVFSRHRTMTKYWSTGTCDAAGMYPQCPIIRYDPFCHGCPNETLYDRYPNTVSFQTLVACCWGSFFFFFSDRKRSIRFFQTLVVSYHIISSCIVHTYGSVFLLTTHAHQNGFNQNASWCFVSVRFCSPRTFSPEG